MSGDTPWKWRRPARLDAPIPAPSPSARGTPLPGEPPPAHFPAFLPHPVLQRPGPSFRDENAPPRLAPAGAHAPPPASPARHLLARAVDASEFGDACSLAARRLPARSTSALAFRAPVALAPASRRELASVATEAERAARRVAAPDDARAFANDARAPLDARPPAHAPPPAHASTARSSATARLALRDPDAALARLAAERELAEAAEAAEAAESAAAESAAAAAESAAARALESHAARSRRAEALAAESAAEEAARDAEETRRRADALETAFALERLAAREAARRVPGSNVALNPEFGPAARARDANSVAAARSAAEAERCAMCDRGEAHGPERCAATRRFFIRGENDKTAESREARGTAFEDARRAFARRLAGAHGSEAVQAAFDDAAWWREVSAGEGEKRRSVAATTKALRLERRGLDAAPNFGPRRLESLVTLDASRNRIAALPAALERSAPRLQHLDVSENNLASGAADDDDDDDDAGIAVVARLAELRAWRADANPRLARLPRAVGDLARLRELSVARCALRALPASVGGLRSLRSLDVSRNRLASLPASLFSPAVPLEALWARGNALDALPETLGEAKRLRRIDVADNRLERFPSVATLARLERLECANNRLRAAPRGLGRGNRALVHLDLDGNRVASLCASFAEADAEAEAEDDDSGGIAALPALVTLTARDNEIAAIGRAFGRSAALAATLQHLDLRRNRLRRVPASLGRLRALRTLKLVDDERTEDDDGEAFFDENEDGKRVNVQRLSPSSLRVLRGEVGAAEGLGPALAVGLDYLEAADEELAECRDWRPGACDACAVEDESLEGADDDTTLRYSGLFSVSTSAGEVFVRSGGASDPEPLGRRRRSHRRRRSVSALWPGWASRGGADAPLDGGPGLGGVGREGGAEDEAAKKALKILAASFAASSGGGGGGGGGGGSGAANHRRLPAEWCPAPRRAGDVVARRVGRGSELDAALAVATGLGGGKAAPVFDAMSRETVELLANARAFDVVRYAPGAPVATRGDEREDEGARLRVVLRGAVEIVKPVDASRASAAEGGEDGEMSASSEQKRRKRLGGDGGTRAPRESSNPPRALRRALAERVARAGRPVVFGSSGPDVDPLAAAARDRGGPSGETSSVGRRDEGGGYSSDGRVAVARVLRIGDALGELSLLAGAPQPEYARAGPEGAETLELCKASARLAVVNDPAFLRDAARGCARRALAELAGVNPEGFVRGGEEGDVLGGEEGGEGGGDSFEGLLDDEDGETAAFFRRATRRMEASMSAFYAEDASSVDSAGSRLVGASDAGPAKGPVVAASSELWARLRRTFFTERWRRKIRALDVLRCFTTDELRGILRRGATEVFPRVGEKLVREGDAGAPAMLIVLRGSLEVMMTSHEPGEAVRGGEGGGCGKGGGGGYGPRSSRSRRRLRDAPILRASRRSYAGGASPRSGSRVAAPLRRDATHARVGVVPEGGTFGENAAVCGGARSRTAVCGERDTAALVVAGDALGWAIRRRPVLADELARALAWRRAWNDFEAERARAPAHAPAEKGGKKKGGGKGGAAFIKPTARDVAALADTIAKTHRAAGGA